jgi:dnd system-associated protein 4
VASLVRQLRHTSDNPHGVFSSYFQILVFAACLGQYQQESIPVKNPATEPDPVRLDIFSNQKLNYVVDLLANCADPKVLIENQESIDKRCLIFESYANAGPHYLKKHCLGDRTLLMVVDKKS